jgi:hypothetical protein
MTRGMTDIADNDQLIAYAAVAQLAWLNHHNTGARITQEAVARAAGMRPGNLANALAGNHGRRLDTRLADLDNAIVTLAADLPARTGGLAGFAALLRGVRGRGDLSTGVPPVWTGELLKERFDRPVGVLLQATALLSTFHAARGEGGVERVSGQYGAQIEKVVNRLILVGMSPPTPHSVEALVLLGSLASYAFDVVANRLEDALWNAPLGFRVWRAVTSLVQASTGESSGLPRDTLRDWVHLQLQDCMRLRAVSLYPARALDLELALAVPDDWSPPHDDWIGELLQSRAQDPRTTVRERSSAALGLWERAARRGGADHVTPYLLELAKRFRAESDDIVRSGVGRGSGMRWTAAALEHAIGTGQKVCNSWPEVDDPCIGIVRGAAAALNVPDRIATATQFLFEQAVLQPGGVHRRRAVDALRAGGWSREVTEALGGILKHPDSDVWLRCRVLFAIGFLQEHGPGVQLLLREACEHGRRGLGRGGRLTRDQVAEMHTALFAVGDCFGAPGAGSEARRIRNVLDGMLTELVDDSSDDGSHLIARAVAYLLAVTAQSGDGTSRLLLEDLQYRYRDVDPITFRVSDWALKSRFVGEVNVLPLHAVE